MDEIKKTEHVIITLLAACRVAVGSALKDQTDGYSDFAMMKLREAIKEGEQWLAG